jgi:transposase InsO family protein
MAAFVREVKRCFSKHHFPAPDSAAACRGLRPAAGHAKREGSKRVREQLGVVSISTLRADLPLDTVQIDHTLVDVSLVDREHRLSIGRPWLKLATDITARAVVGFSVSLEIPSALLISLVLSHAVLQQDGAASEFPRR